MARRIDDVTYVMNVLSRLMFAAAMIIIVLGWIVG